MSFDPATIVDRFVRYVPHHRTLGLRFLAAGDGWAELELPYAPHLVAYPDTGVIASGAIFSLMDSASGISVIMALKRWVQHATLDLRADYLRPATPGATVVGRAETYKLTRSVAFVRGIAHDGDPARPVAHVTGTFMMTDA
ncbi:PaaI family thioesterase [Sandaracinobacteroides saxicola]|uniref:PaaI family thioesterase n=1 Tax=Sandaracinobacteroides saxicola TaxID=2759707 RepID=A0A7G5ILX8_9SPHN|nr:PaaI family thioesterase [Sandaracinobacteroides saxicola]QMW24370.1 PaaI family thioesterase [Sandaracinobacteroides saxicola]